MSIKYSSFDKLQQIANCVTFGEQSEFLVIDFVTLYLSVVAEFFDDFASIVFAEVGHFVCVLEEMIASRRVQSLVEIIFTGNRGDYGNRIFSGVRGDQLLNDVRHTVEVVAVVCMLGNTFGQSIQIIEQQNSWCTFNASR